MFEIFPWNDQLATGIDVIDEQHRVLVRLLNDLAQAHVGGGSAEQVHAVLDELARYADYHFSTEEAIWRQGLADDAWYTRHVHTHQRFFEHIQTLLADERPFQSVLDDLFAYLTKWLAFHILDNDKRMALAVHAVQRGASVPDARAQAEEHMRGAASVLVRAVLDMYQTVCNQALDLMHEKLARQQAETALRQAEQRWTFLLQGDAVTQGGSVLEQRLSELVQQLPAGLVVVQLDSGRFIYANPWFCRMVGYTLPELLQRAPSDIHPVEVLPVIEADMRSLAQAQPVAPIDLPVIRADGSRFMASIARVPLPFQGQTAVMAVFTDISARLAAEDSLAQERLRLQNAIDAVQAGTWAWDITTGQVQLDGRAMAMLGRGDQPGVIDGATYESQWLYAPDLPERARHLRDHLEGRSDSYEMAVRLHHADGHLVWWRSQGRVMHRDAQGQPTMLTGICVDITAQKAHEAQLEHLKLHDALTGLPNRRHFIQTMQALVPRVNQSASMAVLYVDLDGFGAINQVHGPEVGNRLIRAAGARLTAALRPGWLLAHIGGDEFALGVPGLAAETGLNTELQHLLRVMAQPLQSDGLDLTVTASIGAALCQMGPDTDVEQALRQADQAMYQAKLAGRNRFEVFDARHDAATRERLSQLQAVHVALEAGQFVLHYQPQVVLSDGELVGFEALIRWQHPQRGLLAPAMFIPALQHHPLAIALGDWVISAALAQLAHWNAMGLVTTVSVNIDAMQLLDPDFEDRLHRQMAAQPTVQAQQLELEVLETAALHNLEQVSARVARLQALGLTCALDDFGTGYSSLTFLKRLGARVVKIDQSFVRDMLDDPEDARIVDSLLVLAKALGRSVVAEGVETDAHRRALVAAGCRVGQGYAVARPMPATAVVPWLAERAAQPNRV